MNRREFLTVAGLATVTAGCLGGEDDIETGRVTVGTDDEGVERADNGAVLDVGSGTMRVTATDVQRSTFSPLRDNVVYEPESGQFLVIQVESSGMRWDRPGGEVDLVLDGTTPSHDPEIPGSVYLTEDRTEVALGVPAIPTTTAAVRFPHERAQSWTVPDSLVETFDAVPEFHLFAADIHEENQETVLSLTVENRGERDGVFRGTTAPVGDGVPESVRFTVGAGEQVTATVTNDAVAGWSAGDSFSHEVDTRTRVFAVDRS